MQRYSILLLLVLLGLIGISKAAVNPFPRRTSTKRSQDGVNLDVKRLLQSRQLTRDKLVERAKLKATKTGAKKREMSPLPPQKRDFTIIMGRNTYSRSQQNLVIDTTTPYEVFQISGFTTTGNLVSTDNTNMPAKFALSTTSSDPVPLRFSSSAQFTTLICNAETVSSTSGTTRLTCGYAVSATATSPVSFCTRNGDATGQIYVAKADCGAGYSVIYLSAAYTV